jgi:hypothetical protein
MKTEAVKKFVDYLKSDAKLYEATIGRETYKQASFNEGLDHVVKIAAEKGFKFTRAELADALKEIASDEEQLANNQLRNIAGGVLGFAGIRVGLSNPTEVMCQYHAPLEFLARRQT